MIIIGAKGHALEVLDVLRKNKFTDKIIFFDNLTADISKLILYKNYPILSTFEEVKRIFNEDNRFILGIGRPVARQNLAQKFLEFGGLFTSVISKNTLLGDINTYFDEGLNIMHNVFISNNVKIGKGSLLNYGCSVHHDVNIGDFVEISPSAQILGGAEIGSFSEIGAGAIILPKVKIAEYVKVGAGAVVTKDVERNRIVKGIPAK